MQEGFKTLNPHPYRGKALKLMVSGNVEQYKEGYRLFFEHEVYKNDRDLVSYETIMGYIHLFPICSLKTHSVIKRIHIPTCCLLGATFAGLEVRYEMDQIVENNYIDLGTFNATNLDI